VSFFLTAVTTCHTVSLLDDISVIIPFVDEAVMEDVSSVAEMGDVSSVAEVFSASYAACGAFTFA